MLYLLHHAIDESAQRYPDHEAMRFQGKVLTYAELSQRSTQLACFLREQGIQRGDRIGVFLDKSLETPLAIYGIMKAGAAYVPLDPRSPVSRLVNIINDCGIGGIISQNSKLETIQAVAREQTALEFVVGLSGEEAGILRFYDWSYVGQFPKSGPPAIPIMEQDLAYIMYTSGSTGAPKGIMHTHASGLSYARMSAATYGINHTDRLSNHSPLHFDMSTLDYLTGPLCGATTTIIPEAFTLFPANLSKLIEDERLTIWYSVPFALEQILLRGAIDKRDLTSLRWVLYGGEPFNVDHLRQLMEHLPQARFSNVYGPAEINQCTYYHIPPPTEWDANLRAIPLGVIWDNAEGLVLGKDDKPVPSGEAGELVVRTPTMMQGYWNRPDLNTKAFYRREFFPDYNAVFYRTGDLVRQREDGLYEFIGRKDHQVKIRGYRVELAEIDSILVSHHTIEQGAAYVINGANGNEIGASVILKDGHSVTESDLIAFLKDRLPSYAVPQKLRFIAEFPRTSTGKIDRHALQTQ